MRVFSLVNVFISESVAPIRSISNVISEIVNAMSIGYSVFGYFSFFRYFGFRYYPWYR